MMAFESLEVLRIPGACVPSHHLLALADDQTISEIERHISDVRPDARAVWHDLLQNRRR